MTRPFAHGVVLVVAQDLSGASAPPPPAGVVIEPFTGPDWRPLAPLATESQRRGFQRRVELRRACLVAWEAGRPIGYTWVSPVAEARIEGFSLELPFGACYGWNLFVAPAERARGVGSALAGARLLWAHADGYTAMWRLIAPHNVASLRTLARTSGSGTTLLGEMRYLRLGRWFRGSLRPAPPEFASLSTATPTPGAAPARPGVAA